MATGNKELQNLSYDDPRCQLDQRRRTSLRQIYDICRTHIDGEPNVLNPATDKLIKFFYTELEKYYNGIYN